MISFFFPKWEADAKRRLAPAPAAAIVWKKSNTGILRKKFYFRVKRKEKYFSGQLNFQMISNEEKKKTVSGICVPFERGKEFYLLVYIVYTYIGIWSHTGIQT